ncbi:MAG: hypothetical protein AB7Q42_12910 [Acidimicrobiia bacterium]
MTLSSKEFGFWRSLGSLRIAQVLLAWDFLTALLMSSAGTVLLVRHVPSVEAHTELAGDLLVVNSALFGVVLAGFAIVAALLGDKYARLLSASGGSAIQMLRHFLIVAGVLVTSIVAAIAFRAAGEAIAAWKAIGEQWALGFTIFVFLWGLFSTLELMKLILGVAVTNTAFRAINGEGQSGDDSLRSAR